MISKIRSLVSPRAPGPTPGLFLSAPVLGIGLLVAAWIPGSQALSVQAGSDPGPAAQPSAVHPDDRESDETFAFVGVNVIPMDGFRILEDQTVVVRRGEITEVGHAGRVQVPDAASRIDGEGRWLLPGLAEMHAHIPGGETPREVVHDLMFLYVANGVTVIRGMLGHPSQFDLRERVERGEVAGPTMALAAPSLSGSSVPSADSAEALVRAHAAAGYDLLKIHPGLSREAWDRMVETAREEGITYAGHIPAEVGLRHALATGISTVDHLDGYLQEVVSEEVRERMEAGEEVGLEEMLRSADGQEIRAIAARTRAAGAWNAPTLYLWENFYAPVDPDSMIALPEMRYVPREMREGWAEMKRNRGAGSPELSRLHGETRGRILKALNDTGAGILMGTDSPQMFNVPGFSSHREIRRMEAAGLTPFEILLSGTRNVAEYFARDLGLPGNFGTVEAGHRADLILLEANPLDDLENLQRRAGVMVRGEWIPESEIQERLEAVAERYGG